MKRLPLVLSNGCSNLDISRKIQKIYLINIIELDDSSDLLAALTKHGQNVQELVIRRMHLTASDLFCDVLRLLPQLRKISIDDIHFNHEKEIVQRVETPHLTRVVLIECHQAVSAF